MGPWYGLGGRSPKKTAPEKPLKAFLGLGSGVAVVAAGVAEAFLAGGFACALAAHGPVVHRAWAEARVAGAVHRAGDKGRAFVVAVA